MTHLVITHLAHSTVHFLALSLFCSLSAYAAPPSCLFNGGLGERAGTAVFGASCLKQEKPSYVFFTETKTYLRLYIVENCEQYRECYQEYAMEDQEQCDAALFHLSGEKHIPEANQNGSLKPLILAKQAEGGTRASAPLPFIRISYNFWGEKTISVGTSAIDCTPISKGSAVEISLQNEKQRLRLAQTNPTSKPGNQLVSAPANLRPLGAEEDRQLSQNRIKRMTESVIPENPPEVSAAQKLGASDSEGVK